MTHYLPPDYIFEEDFYLEKLLGDPAAEHWFHPNESLKNYSSYFTHFDFAGFLRVEISESASDTVGFMPYKGGYYGNVYKTQFVDPELRYLLYRGCIEMIGTLTEEKFKRRVEEPDLAIWFEKELVKWLEADGSISP